MFTPVVLHLRAVSRLVMWTSGC